MLGSAQDHARAVLAAAGGGDAADRLAATEYAASVMVSLASEGELDAWCCRAWTGTVLLNGAPGERAVYHSGYYAAFVLDPDGHNVEVVNHNGR